MFQFAGDTDQDTDGLISASCCRNPKVVVAEAIGLEWNLLGAGDAQPALDRLGRESGLTDLRMPMMIRTENGFTPPRGTSYAEFSKLYKPPILVYSCPCCDNGEAIEIANYSVPDFIDHGGQVLVIGDLMLSSD